MSEIKLEIISLVEQLLSRIKVWKDDHVVKAPFSGICTFITLLSENQYITENTELAYISPNVDGAMCFVLADDKTAKDLGIEPIYLSGFGWCSETPWLATRGMDAEYAKKAAKITQTEFAGVDLIKSKGKYYLIEVNRAPQFKGFREYTKINPCPEIIDYLEKKVAK